RSSDDVATSAGLPAEPSEPSPGWSTAEVDGSRWPVVDPNLDLFLRPPLFLLDIGRQSSPIGVRERRLNDRTRPKTSLLDHVHLGRQERHLRAEIDPREEPDHRRKRA